MQRNKPTIVLTVVPYDRGNSTTGYQVAETYIPHGEKIGRFRIPATVIYDTPEDAGEHAEMFAIWNNHPRSVYAYANWVAAASGTYTYQVEQCHLPYGPYKPGEIHVFHLAHWRKPFTRAQDAIDELEACPFPGRVMRLHKGITAGVIHTKAMRDGLFTDYWKARLIALGVMEAQDEVDSFLMSQMVNGLLYSRVRLCHPDGTAEICLFRDPTF